MAKVFKGKYFPHNSPLEGKLGSRSSFAWKSIFESQDLMKMGMRKEFGNGATVCVTKDPWLPVIPPMPPMVKPNADSSSIYMNLLRDEGLDEWKMYVLREMFEEEDVRLIV